MRPTGLMAQRGTVCRCRAWGRRSGQTLTPFIPHLFAALAEKERAMIATRTKAALAAAKARGVALGGPKLAEPRRTRP